MVIKSGLFNSVNRDRVYKAEDFASYFASFIGNGVFPNPSTGLKVEASGTGMNIILKPGRGWINGYYLVNDADHTIKIDTADAVLKRIDRIVMQLNYLNREIAIVVNKGSYSASPVATPVRRDADVYELVLADVLVGNGVIQLLQAHITDQRLNTALCGIVHGVVNQVDTTAIFNQYQSWFDSYSLDKASEFEIWKTNIISATEQWIVTQKDDFESWRSQEEVIYLAWSNNRRTEFDTWFATIRDILDTNVAGNLELQIENHINARLPHIQIDTVTGKKYKTGWVIENGALFFEAEEVI